MHGHTNASHACTEMHAQMYNEDVNHHWQLQPLFFTGSLVHYKVIRRDNVSSENNCVPCEGNTRLQQLIAALRLRIARIARAHRWTWLINASSGGGVMNYSVLQVLPPLAGLTIKLSA